MSFVHVESDNNDIFRKTGANFNMMLIWLMYDDFTQNGWENRQKHMAELRDTLYIPEFVKTVGSIGFSDKKLFDPTGRRSTFHCLVR